MTLHYAHPADLRDTDNDSAACGMPVWHIRKPHMVSEQLSPLPGAYSYSANQTTSAFLWPNDDDHVVQKEWLMLCDPHRYYAIYDPDTKEVLSMLPQKLFRPDEAVSSEDNAVALRVDPWPNATECLFEEQHITCVTAVARKGTAAAQRLQSIQSDQWYPWLYAADTGKDAEWIQQVTFDSSRSNLNQTCQRLYAIIRNEEDVEELRSFWNWLLEPRGEQRVNLHVQQIVKRAELHEWKFCIVHVFVESV